MVVYLTGLGQVDGNVATGQAAPLSTLTPVQAAVEVQVGDRRVAPFFAGLTPGLVGVYQVNVRVPAGTPSGDNDVIISIGGSASPAAKLPVR